MTHGATGETRGAIPVTPTVTRGFTTVEVLVALALSMILLAALLASFVANQQSFRIQNAMNDLNDNGRFAMQQITYHLRMSNFWGGGASLENQAAYDPSTDINEYCDLSAGTLVATRNAAIATGCLEDPITGYTHLPLNNSSYIQVSFADPAPVPDADLDSSGIYVRGRAGGATSFAFKGTDVSVFADTPLEDASMINVSNYPLRIFLYYIAQCVTSDSDDICDDDNISSVTASSRLERMELTGDTMQSVRIANHATQLLIQYLVDVNLDGSDLRLVNPGPDLDGYLSDPNAIRSVVGARVSLEMQHPVRLPGRTTPLLRVFSSVVKLRNTN